MITFGFKYDFYIIFLFSIIKIFKVNNLDIGTKHISVCFKEKRDKINNTIKYIKYKELVLLFVIKKLGGLLQVFSLIKSAI